MRLLDKFETRIYEGIMRDIPKTIDVFNWKAPCTFLKKPLDFDGA